MTESEYAEKKADLPAVCLAFKCPIPNMETVLNKPLFSVDLQSLVQDDGQVEEVSCLSATKISGGVFYQALTKVGGDDLKVTLSETEYHNKVTQFDLHPLIYFRLTNPLKAGARLPTIDLKTVYG
jgi:hypothetical protein